MRSLTRSLGLCLLVLALPASAGAAYDMSGPWILVPSVESSQRLDLVQSAGTLSTPNPPQYSAPWAGTIDEGTGAFHLEFPVPGCEELWMFDGVVASDGRTFAGTVRSGIFVQAGCASYDDCVMVTTQVTGTRCGNNQLDPWEECDFGDTADGDCCSSACLLAPAGESCTADSTECTSDLCNATGTCEHVPVAGACVEPNGCGVGVCTSGACEITAPEPAGTPCDRDASVCTPDVCDAAGSCTAGVAISCWPCGICDREAGCIQGTHPCDGEVTCDSANTEAVKLKLKTSDRTRRNRLRMEFETPAELDALGDPVDNSTWYALCLYADDGVVARSILNTAVPSGGLCDGEFCWTERSQEGPFLYRDQSGAAGGLSALRVRPWDGFLFKGSGENLALPTELPISSTLVSKVIAWESGEFYERRCWSHAVPALRWTTDTFRGEYRAD